MKRFGMTLPGQVYAGEGSMAAAAEIIRKERAKKAALFTDKGVRNSGALDGLTAILEREGVSCRVFDQVPSEPDYRQVQEIADAFCREPCGLIIAAGGGSVMDTAKLVSVLADGRHQVEELLEEPSLARKTVPTLMIPTTAGTGAEATCNSIVAVPEKELKVGIVSKEMMTDYVILDASVLKDLPFRIAANTGMDALCHALECYISNKANPFSDTFALAALEMIFSNIEKACRGDMEGKKQMLTAAFYGGIAIAASGTTAVHALSYPLGGKYHIPHGEANAMLLAPVMRLNEEACRGRLAAVYDKALSDGGEELSEKEKSQAVIRKLEELTARLEIPTSLNRYGITREDAEDLVKAGMDVKRLLDNNPKIVTEEDARNIYLGLIDG